MKKNYVLQVLVMFPLLMFSQWTQVGEDIEGEALFDESGTSVSLSADGNIVAIGGRFNRGGGPESGHVRVYENVAGIWTQVGQDIDGEGAFGQSGWSVSLSADGRMVAIGALANQGDGGVVSGHVRVYEHIAGIWTQVGEDINGEVLNDLSGESVSLSSDGSIVAIGSRFNDGNGFDSGHIRVYENMSGVWTQVGDDIDGEAERDQSGGSSVSLSSDGNIVAIGAIKNDGNGTDSGHVRVYENSENLSIGDNVFGSEVSLYPNPVSHSSKIILRRTYAKVQLLVYNTSGHVVSESEHVNTDNIVINAEQYASGVYFLKLTSEGKSYTLKMIKE